MLIELDQMRLHDVVYAIAPFLLQHFSNSTVEALSNSYIDTKYWFQHHKILFV
jgi:hypothetical protein